MWTGLRERNSWNLRDHTATSPGDSPIKIPPGISHGQRLVTSPAPHWLGRDPTIGFWGQANTQQPARDPRAGQQCLGQTQSPADTTPHTVQELPGVSAGGGFLCLLQIQDWRLLSYKCVSKKLPELWAKVYIE